MPTELNLIDFFARIFQDTEGVVRLATRNKEMVFSNQLYRWPDQGSLMVSYIDHAVSQDCETYFSPDLYKLEAIADRKATKDYVLGSHVICLDFDGNAPSTDEWYKENKIPLPSIRIQSSVPENQHVYWVLEEFVTDIHLLEAMRKTVTYQSKADSSGWDAGQLLRPPYTKNFGYGKDRTRSYDVIVEEITSRIYPITQFPAPKDTRPLVASALDITALPFLGKVLAEGHFVDGFSEAFFQPLENIPAKKRSDTLMAVGYYAAESGLTDAEILCLVQDADTRWGKYVHRTDRPKRLIDIVDRARNKYPYGGTVVNLRDSEAETLVSPRLFFQFGDMMDTDAKIEWYFDGLLSVGGYGIIAGIPGIGKTQLALRASVAVALGTDFLRWKNVTGKQGKVMFLSLEMALPQLKFFLAQMDDLAQHRQALQDRFTLYPLGETIPLDKPEGQKILTSCIEEQRPDFLVIDSLSKASHGSLSDDETVRKINSYFNVLCKTYNLCILVVAHSRKLQDKRKEHGELDDLYGSRFIGSEADFVVSFVNGSDDTITVVGSKIRLGPPIRKYTLIRTPQLDFRVEDYHEGPSEVGLSAAFYDDAHRLDTKPVETTTKDDKPATGFDSF
jgi:hypothetical protein